MATMMEYQILNNVTLGSGCSKSSKSWFAASMALFAYDGKGMVNLWGQNLTVPAMILCEVLFTKTPKQQQ